MNKHRDTEPTSEQVAVDAREVVDALPRSVIVTTTDGRILLWNSEAEMLYGWNEAEVLVVTWLSRIDAKEGLVELYFPIRHRAWASADRLALMRLENGLEFRQRRLCGLHSGRNDGGTIAERDLRFPGQPWRNQDMRESRLQFCELVNHDQ